MARVIVTGVTGTAGFDALRATVDSPAVAHVIALARRQPNLEHEKLEVILHDDFSEYPKSVLDRLRGCDGVIWALGISQNGISKEDYERITETYPLAAAEAFRSLNPDKRFTFAFLSGGGATWRPGMLTPSFGIVKGRVEKRLTEMETTNFRVYNFRAGGIVPDSTAEQSGRRPPAWQTALVPALKVVYPSSLISARHLGAVMLKSITHGLEGFGGAKESGVLSNSDIRALRV